MGIKKRKLLTLIISAMVLTGFCVAPVTAKPAPVVAAAAPVIIGGVELSCKAAIVIADVLGMVVVKEALEKRHADVHEDLRKVSEGFTSWFSSLSQWIRLGSNEAKKLLEIENALRMHDVYHEARVTKDGKSIEINKNAITKKMRQIL